jgi:hypothetical protein
VAGLRPRPRAVGGILRLEPAVESASLTWNERICVSPSYPSWAAQSGRSSRQGKSSDRKRQRE